MPDYGEFKILVDMPTPDPAMGFGQTAVGLADLIRKSEPRFTVGVFGTWGSGKTTLMNAIKSELGRHRIVTVDFSAWRYEREEHLLVPLLDTIRHALVEWARKVSDEQVGDATPEASRLQRFSRSALKTASTIGKVMASMLAGLSLKVGLPGAVEMSFDANTALKSVQGTLNAGHQDAADDGAGAGNVDEKGYAARRADPALPQSTYHACFNALQTAFEEFSAETEQTRIVVFVDDLDRCLPAGALDVLESMKLFFDLHGFVFVVGLDRKVVERCVDSRYVVEQNRVDSSEDGRLEERIVRGSDYLKKIFQVPYSLAPIAVDQLDDLIDSLQNDSGLACEQADDLRDRVRRHLDYLVAGNSINPREVKRYINAYTLQMKVKPQLNPDAVLALQTIIFRTDCEQLADAVRTYGFEFTSALRAYVEGETDALEEYDVAPADFPADLQGYLDMAGPGKPLAQVENIDDYLYAGEAVRSSRGGVYVSLLRTFRELRGHLTSALNTTSEKELVSIRSSCNSLARKMTDLVMDLGESQGLQGVMKELDDLQTWCESNDSPGWIELDGVGADLTEDVRARAREHFDDRIDRVRVAIRRLRRRARVSGSEAF